MIQSFITSQRRLSRWFENFLPEKYSCDGNYDFQMSFVPAYLGEDLIIYDIGGGKNPYLNAELKQRIRATVVGLDIDQAELDQAPYGGYDKVICADITTYSGNRDADLVICQAVLEHVSDTSRALEAIASILKPGGLALLFVPSRNSAFARLNLLLPQTLKRKLLRSIYPDSGSDQGFPAYYDRCTPADFQCMTRDCGFSIIEQRYFLSSAYFTFFFPAHLLWRAWVLMFHLVRKEQAAETFSLALRKSSNAV